MMTIDQALRKIWEHAPAMPSEEVPLARAVGRVVARDLHAREDLPAFDNSTMDGYAVRAKDLAGAGETRPVKLELSEIVRAGKPARRELEKGQAMKIMTGAPLPARADAVVMKEQAAYSGNGSVKIFHAPKPGEWIRPRGRDVAREDLLLEAGALIRPYEVALLAAQGIGRVPVYRNPLVAVLSTGDELVRASSSPALGQIRDSNGPAIAAALAGWGIPCLDLGIVPDEARKIEARLKAALSRADLVLISGGVSVGDFDLTKPILEKMGMKTIFWKVKIKPGKPLLFGVCPRKNQKPAPVFGLPGNPISVLVCLEEFVRPALEKMRGRVAPTLYPLRGRAVNGFELPQERQQRLFCRASETAQGFEIRILSPQASHMMARCSRANALAAPGPEMKKIKRGDILPFRFLE